MSRYSRKLSNIIEANILLEKRFLSEQVAQPQSSGQTTTQTAPTSQYKIEGTKFCYDGMCKISISIKDDKSKKNIIFKTKEDSEKKLQDLYSKISGEITKDMEVKKITGITIPTIDQLKDLSPKKT